MYGDGPLEPSKHAARLEPPRTEASNHCARGQGSRTRAAETPSRCRARRLVSSPIARFGAWPPSYPSLETTHALPRCTFIFRRREVSIDLPAAASVQSSRGHIPFAWTPSLYESTNLREVA